MIIYVERSWTEAQVWQIFSNKYFLSRVSKVENNCQIYIHTEKDQWIPSLISIHKTWFKRLILFVQPNFLVTSLMPGLKWCTLIFQRPLYWLTMTYNKTNRFSWFIRSTSCTHQYLFQWKEVGGVNSLIRSSRGFCNGTTFLRYLY